MQPLSGPQGVALEHGSRQATVILEPDGSTRAHDRNIGRAIGQAIGQAIGRARRRHTELMQRGAETSYEEVLEDVSKRDYLDMGRELGGLKKALDAVELDTSELSPEQVAESIVKLAKSRLKMQTRKIDKNALEAARRQAEAQKDDSGEK